MADPIEQPATLGIPPARSGPLAVLQFESNILDGPRLDRVHSAARAICIAAPSLATAQQGSRILDVQQAVASVLTTLVDAAPPGPERSTAISRFREGLMWAEAAIKGEQIG